MDRQPRRAIERENATEILATLGTPTALADIRDHAIFSIGWLTALRRSNIGALRRRDVAIRTDRLDGRRYLDVFVRRSKTDQEGHGRNIVVSELPGQHPLCAVRALERWLAALELAPDAPIFQSFTLARRHEDRHLTGNAIRGADISRVIKRMLARAGIDPTEYAAHSLRRGFATTMQNAGVPDAIGMDHGGWRDKATYHRYNRVDKARRNAIRDLFG